MVWGTAGAGSLEFVKTFGAAQAVDYRGTPLKDLRDKFDIIPDAASTSSYGECAGLLTPRGTYITLLPAVGFITGMIRSMFSTRNCKICVVTPKQKDLDQTAALLENQSIVSPVAETYPLEQLPAAPDRLSHGRVRGKIGIEMRA